MYERRRLLLVLRMRALVVSCCCSVLGVKLTATNIDRQSRLSSSNNCNMMWGPKYLMINVTSLFYVVLVAAIVGVVVLGLLIGIVCGVCLLGLCLYFNKT